MNDNFVASQIWLVGSILQGSNLIGGVMLTLGVLFWTLYAVEKYYLRRPT